MSESDNEQTKVRIAEIITRGEVTSKIVQVIFKWGSLVAIVYIGSDAVIAVANAWAGQATMADIRIQAVVDWMSGDTSSFLSTAFGLCGVLFGTIQWRLRKDVIEKLSPYQQRYEQLIDPSRTSSQLTPRGDTPPED